MSEKIFEFKIIRTTGHKTVMVEWIDVHSPNGNFIVSFDSSPIISTLKYRGKLRYKDSKQQTIESFDIYGGIFKVQDNKAIVILDL